MTRFYEIDEIKASSTVKHPKYGEVFVKTVRIVSDTYAVMVWAWAENSDSYFSTDFRKSQRIATFGLWHDLTTQCWSSDNA